MNVPLLRKIQEAITAEPGHFDMAFYASPSPCGTTACIAGWAVALRTGHALEELEERKTRGVEQLAVEALDLPLFSAGAVSRQPLAGTVPALLQGGRNQGQKGRYRRQAHRGIHRK